MNNEELQKKIDEYCASQSCKGCIFGDAVNLECLADVGTADELTLLKALNRFKKEILGECKKTIPLQFELLEDGYKLITEDETLKEIVFNTEDLTDLTQAEATQAKLEYIFYKVRKGE